MYEDSVPQSTTSVEPVVACFPDEIMGFLFLKMYFLLLFLAVVGLLGGAQASLDTVHRFSCHPACGILVPGPGTKPSSPALEDGVLTPRLPGKSPSWASLDSDQCTCSKMSPHCAIAALVIFLFL